ncbi:MAG: hypothetical protein QOK29_2322 [Rhodospirillaceae bacterium]|jgi:2-hydroxymuconate-semialdehyde hydrolase|nr:hypothetical protein [Rhodospirillaceae bacterium]
MALREHDIQFESIPIHVWEGGQGFPILMLHGSGAGASIVGNFRRVLDGLSKSYRVLAADLVGFGLSGDKPQEPYFDMDLWLRQAKFLINRLSADSIGIIGHSLSGAIALKAAADDKRVTKVLTTGTMGAPHVEEPGVLGGGWTYPEDRTELRRFVESTVDDKAKVEEQDIDYRERILRRDGYRDYYKNMFKGPRGQYINASALTDDELKRVKSDVVMMHGANDGSFTPEETTLRLARKLPQADVVLLGGCGHSVAFEYPKKFLAVCDMLFGKA